MLHNICCLRNDNFRCCIRIVYVLYTYDTKIHYVHLFSLLFTASHDTDLDAILGELCALESQFDHEIRRNSGGHTRSSSVTTTSSANTVIHQPTQQQTQVSVNSTSNVINNMGGMDGDSSSKNRSHRLSGSGGTTTTTTTTTTVSNGHQIPVCLFYLSFLIGAFRIYN